MKRRWNGRRKRASSGLRRIIDRVSCGSVIRGAGVMLEFLNGPVDLGIGAVAAGGGGLLSNRSCSAVASAKWSVSPSKNFAIAI